MNPFIFIYTEFLWRPLFNGLVFFYNVLPIEDLGLAIIALTIVIRIILAPLLWKAQRAQRDLARIHPEIKKIQDELKHDRDAQGKAMMELYSKHKVNPFSGCLILLIQLPILIALFQVFRTGLLPEQLSYLYSFIENPGRLNPIMFGVLDLAKGNLFLGVVAAVTQYFQTKLSMTSQAVPVSGKGGDFTRMLQWQTQYIFPALILVWSYTFPSALILYWTVLNVLGIVQEIIMKSRRFEHGSGSDKTGN